MAVYDEHGNELSAVYGADGHELDYAYSESGNVIYVKDETVYPSELTLLHSAQISSGQSPQGMATYGNYIFQFFSGANILNVYNKADYSLINSMNCNIVGHGNNLQFGTEVQSNGFPLLYVSDSGSAEARYIYVLSVSTTSFELVETITLPSSAGNYLNAVIDFEEEKIYVLGYTASTVYDTTGKNIVCALDLNDPTTLLDTWQYNYLGVENGLVWNGKHIVLCTNTWNGTDVKFYFINPSTHRIDTTLTFEKEYDSEYEGFSYEGIYYLVSKWIYKNVSSNRTIYYEFYRLY